MLVVGFGTYRVDHQPARTALYNQLRLGLEGVVGFGAQENAVVASSSLVLVPEQREHGNRS
jgi:hypothetical protein